MTNEGQFADFLPHSGHQPYLDQAKSWNTTMHNWLGERGGNQGDGSTAAWGDIFYDDMDAFDENQTEENYNKVANQINVWDEENAWGNFEQGLDDLASTRPIDLPNDPLNRSIFDHQQNMYNTQSSAYRGDDGGILSFNDYIAKQNPPTLTQQADTLGDENDILTAGATGTGTAGGATTVPPDAPAPNPNQASYDALVNQATKSSALAALLGINTNKRDYFNTGTLNNVGPDSKYTGTLADAIATALGQQGTSQFDTYDGAAAPKGALADAIKKLTEISNARDQYVNDAIGASAGSYGTALNSLGGIEGLANTNQYSKEGLTDLLTQVGNAAGRDLSSDLNTAGYDTSAKTAASEALGTRQAALRDVINQLEATRLGNVTDMRGRRGTLDDSLGGLNDWDEEGINALIGNYDTLRGDASGYSGGLIQQLRDNIGIGQGNANEKLQGLFGKRDDIREEAQALYEMLGKQQYYGLRDVTDQEAGLQTLKDKADKWGASGASGDIGYAEALLNNERDRIKQDQTNKRALDAGSASQMRAYLESMGLGNSTSLDRFLSQGWAEDTEEDPRQSSFWGDTVNSGFNWL
jgi:hypothetical protein